MERHIPAQFKANYSISIHQNHTLYLQLRGMWKSKEFEAFHADIIELFTTMLRSEDHFHLVIDITEFGLQKPGTWKQMRSLIRWAVINGAEGPITILTPRIELSRRFVSAVFMTGLVSFEHRVDARAQFEQDAGGKERVLRFPRK